MPKKSKVDNVVRRSVDDIPQPTSSHLSDLLTAMEGTIDTTDIPETRRTASRVRRDASGRLPKPRESPIRRAILDELERRKMTRYQLWVEARSYCETLTQSAVYEYLRGQRDIRLPYAEALLQALGLGVSLQKPSRLKV